MMRHVAGIARRFHEVSLFLGSLTKARWHTLGAAHFFEDEQEPPTVNGYPQTANCKLLTTSH
jgi:hypothetical protein